MYLLITFCQLLRINDYNYAIFDQFNLTHMEAVAIEKHQEHKEKIAQVLAEVGKVVVGQEYMVHRLLVGLFTNGHILLEGVPGLAKTLTVSTLAQVLHLDFQRIQFTPDLLPADLVGTMIYNQKDGKFEVRKGPIFANIILADEINRSPAKVQSALLEAMQEKTVTIGDNTFKLDRPFLVMATQNPVDQEGTYPLPEAQVDRFMMKVVISYPTKDQELEVMRRISNMKFDFTVNTMLTKEEIFDIRDQVNRVKISPSLEQYIIELVYATRQPLEYKLNEQAQYIQFGASPRASINLNLAAKAVAYMGGRDYVLPEDIKEVAQDVMNHRIILNYEAEADNVKTTDVIKAILNKVPINK
jgi:MoxR-like ATPase